MGSAEANQTSPQKASSLSLPCCSLQRVVQLLSPWLSRQYLGLVCLEVAGGCGWATATSSPGARRESWGQVAQACVHERGMPNESAPTTHPFSNVDLNVLLWFLGLRHLLMA